MRIDIELKGMTQVLTKMRKIPTRVRNGSMTGINHSLMGIRDLARDNLNNVAKRVNPRTHGVTYGTYTHYRINESWVREDAKVEGGMVTGHLKNISTHSAAVEFGVGHSIFPTSAPYLKFKVGPGKNDWRTAKFVTGQVPVAYLQNATLTYHNIIPQIISSDILSQLQGL